MPATGKFTAEQRKLYDVVVNVQKTVIANVKPGAHWQELHDLAVKMLADAGGLDKSYTYGIGHFIGMEVHDHGDYVGPLKPGMVIAIEQGAIVNGLRVAFEDDVLVTEQGPRVADPLHPDRDRRNREAQDRGADSSTRRSCW